jgi:hypothetical protein
MKEEELEYEKKELKKLEGEYEKRGKENENRK